MGQETQNCLEEEWRPVVGYEGHYEVSNIGRVRSLTIVRRIRSKPRILRPIKFRRGYTFVSLSDASGKKHSIKISRIVAKAFLPNPDNLPCVNHKDEDRANNAVDNLEWCTYVYNTHYGHCIEKIRASKAHLFRKVIQMDADGNYIDSFESLSEAKRKTGINNFSISNVCRGVNKTAGGYRWKYA